MAEGALHTMLQNNTLTRIGYLGPAGTYSEEAALAFSRRIAGGELVPFSGIESVIRAVAEGKVEYGVAPLENSIEGSVNITLDTLAHSVELCIVREIVLPIRHFLFVGNLSATVKTIASHPQALAQCRNYLATCHPSADIKAVESTAAAAEMVSKGLVSGAIASIRAGQLFDLIPLKRDIQDSHCNQTRFVVLSQRPESLGASKMSLVCRILGDKPGSLCEMLSEFAMRGVNLTRIESRPARTALGEYIFFIDLDGTLEQPEVVEAVRVVETKSLWLKNLGMYAVDFPDVCTKI